MRLLTDIDFCCSIVGLSYKGNQRYKSWLGGVLSIAIVISFIIIVTYYLNEFFSRSTSKMAFEDMKYWNAPENHLSKDFTLAVMMQYKGVNQFRDDLIMTEAYYYNKTESNLNISRLNFIPCDRSLFINNEEYFDKLELEKAKCINFTNITIEGTSVTDILKYVQIKYLLCLDGKECHPRDEQEELFQELKPITYIYFLDTAFQTNNKKEKVTHFVNYIEVNVTYKNAKVTNIYFSENEMQVDESYFFSSPPKKFIYPMIDSYRDLVSVRTEQQTEALNINLMSSKNKQIISISYMQLSELLANIGALINILMFMIMGLGNYINHYFFQNELMKSLFEFDGKKKHHNHHNNAPKEKQSFNGLISKSQNSVTIFKDTKSVHSFSSAKQKTKKQLTKGKSLTKEKEFKDIETILFSITFIIPCIKHNKAYRKRIEKYFALEKQLSLFQDLLNVYKKIQEIDILKYLLFTKRQLITYENIPKPIIFKNKMNEFLAPKKSIIDLYHDKGVITLRKDFDISSSKTNSTQESLSKYVKKKISENDIEGKLSRILNDRLAHNNML